MTGRGDFFLYASSTDFADVYFIPSSAAASFIWTLYITTCRISSSLRSSLILKYSRLADASEDIYMVKISSQILTSFLAKLRAKR